MLQTSPTTYINQISSLPIFLGLEKNDLEGLLRESSVISYSRDMMLFLEGEKAQSFYVILHGAVKLFKSNAQGQELILNIARQGQNISLSSALLNTICLSSAQVLKDSKLLVIPISTIRNHIKNSRDLAENMMFANALQARELMHHLGGLALKNTEEKICWFLLNLFLENGKKLRTFKLPYNKTLIAAYLNIKPETLSRGFQAIQKKGLIKLEGGVVTICHDFGLCEYCDLEAASKCHFHGKSECPNPQI